MGDEVCLVKDDPQESVAAQVYVLAAGPCAPSLRVANQREGLFPRVECDGDEREAFICITCPVLLVRVEGGV